MTEDIHQRLIEYLSHPLGPSFMKYWAPHIVADLEQFLDENNLKIAEKYSDE